MYVKIDSSCMQHDEASTCVYKIDYGGMQKDKASTCKYKIGSSGITHVVKQNSVCTRLKAVVSNKVHVYTGLTAVVCRLVK